MTNNLRAAAAALIVAAAAACGGGGGGSVTGPTTGGTTGGGGTPPSNQVSCGTNTICMTYTAPDTYSTNGNGTGSFTPTTLTVSQGATVTFANNSGVAHNVVFDATPPAGGDIGVISSGTQTRTFSAKGTYPFHCAIHEGMVGAVTVQ